MNQDDIQKELDRRQSLLEEINRRQNRVDHIKSILANINFHKSQRRGKVQDLVAKAINEKNSVKLRGEITDILKEMKVIRTMVGSKYFYKHIDACQDRKYRFYDQLTGQIS